MIQRTGNRLKIWLMVVGIFVLGGVTGASLSGVYRSQAGGDRPRAHNRRGDTGARLEELRRELDLNDQQAVEVRIILEEMRNEYRSLRREAHPRYDAVRQNARTRTRAVLTPEQQQLFDAAVARREARRNSRYGGREQSEP